MSAEPSENSRKKNSPISLESLSEMIGFPINVIKDELSIDDSKEEISLEQLRQLMLSYIDQNLVDKNGQPLN